MSCVWASLREAGSKLHITHWDWWSATTSNSQQGLQERLLLSLILGREMLIF